MGGLLGRLFGRRKSLQERVDQAERILGIVERVIGNARDFREAKARLIRGAQEGDLDDVISWAQQRDARVKDFLKGG